MTNLLYRYGLIIGLLCILLAVSWDLITKGPTCLFVFWQYAIGYKGVLVILLGVTFLLLHLWAIHKVKSYGYMTHTEVI